MPANTTCMSFPYPLDSDRIDVANDIKRLAQAVDSAVCGIQIPDLDARYVNRTGDTMTGMLTLPSTNPTSNNHAVRKQWVDQNFVHVSGDTMTGALILDNVNYTSDNAATRRAWQIATFLNKTGDTMTGDLDMNGHSVVDLASPPPGPNSAVALTYLNSRLADYVEISGDRMTGTLGVGTAPGSGNGWTIDNGGTAAAAHNVNGPQLSLRKGGSADAVGQVYIRFERGGAPGTLVGAISVGANQNQIHLEPATVTGPSDYRLKEPTGAALNALERVRELAAKVYRGRWRNNGVESDFVNAHDVAEVAPWAVSGDKDGERMQGVDFAALIPTLLAAIGELAEKVEVARA